MIFQYRNIGLGIICKFAIGEVAYAGALTMVPNEYFFVIGNSPVTFRIICAATASIVGRPGFLQIIGGIGAHAPVVSISAHFPIYIKIIEQYEFTRQCMQVRRVFFSE